MTVQFGIGKQAALADLVARLEAGEEVVLTRDGEAVAVVNAPPTASTQGPRRLGLWDHLNLDLPDDLFIGPDPETLRDRRADLPRRR